MARLIRVSTIAYSPVEKGDNWLERTHDKMAALLEEAARAKPDIVCFPEFCTVLGLGDEAYEMAEPIPGPTSDRMAEIARKHSMYVVCPLPERDGNQLYNTAAFIDRNGEIIGKYHKYQPTIGEMEKGIIPGVDAEVFETDFGPVGAAICFDMKFIEVGQRLSANGAKLVFFPSMFIAGDRLLHWARDFGFYVVSSCPARSYIVDMAGRFLAETGNDINPVRSGAVPPIASALINVDRCLFHLDFNQKRLPDIVKKYGAGVEVEIHSPEAHFTLASVMDDVTVESIIEEFELEPWTAYLDRARGVRRDVLDGVGVRA
jgi:predicted amidohydrolase